MNLYELIDWLNGVIWSQWLVGLCLVTGLYLSFSLRFLQFRLFSHMLSQLLEGKESESGISSFQGFALALGGRVGTGNIAGVATAIASGGPGAVFWMWVIALLGAGSACTEATLAQVYKEKIDGEYRGGPPYYIEKGLKIRWFAILFAVCAVVACGVFLPGVQANSIASAVENAFGIPRIITGLIVTLLLAFVIFGGTRRLAHAAQWIVPVMAVCYVFFAGLILIVYIKEVPSALVLIFKSAFGLDPVFGGILGSAISMGVKRGIYSNEAGQGTAPMAAAAAEVSHPAKQGIVQAFSVYVDTLLVCTATALMILVTGSYNVVNPQGGFLVQKLSGVEAGPGFTQAAMDLMIPGYGQIFVAIALFFFAFTTLMAYFYYAESNLAWLTRGGKYHQGLFFGIKVFLLCMCFLGTIKNSTLAWALGDIGVGIMAWLNLVAILLLSRLNSLVIQDYENQYKQGKDPVFDPKSLGISDTSVW